MLTKKEKLFKFRKYVFHTMFPYKGDSTPVFIGGEQRSGTNFLTNVLNRCKQSECYLESDDKAFDNYVLRDISVIRKLINESKAQVTVFKPICDSQNFQMLLNEFPNGRVIWTYRHYNDVINSSLKNFKEHRKYLYYMLYEPEVAGWRLQNVTADDLKLVQHYYDQGIDDSSSRALIWYLRNLLFFQQGFDTNDKVILTRYEKLVKDPVNYFKHIYRFLNIPDNPKASKIAFSSSIGKNQPPKIHPEIQDLCETLINRMISHQL